MSSKNKQGRAFSEETVIARARRMMRSELTPVAKALGLEKYEPESFNAKIAELNKGREEGVSASDAANRRAKELEEKLIDVTAKLQQKTGEVNRIQRELQNTQVKLEQQSAEFDIRELALGAGIRDMDYALHLFRQHAKSVPDGEEIESENIRTFFEGLKKTKPHIFTEERVAAGPRSIADEKKDREAAPANTSGKPGEATMRNPPSPTEPGRAGTGDEVNAEGMTKQQFNKYTREQYGYTPGMA